MECIRGHRSSLCRHHMRPLLQVRSKGRPNVHANGNKNHRIAVFAEEIARTPEPEGNNCKDYPVIILKASDKQVIDLTNGQILGPYEERVKRSQPPNPVIRPDSFIHSSACCSKGVMKTRKSCLCNKKTVSKSNILKFYINKKMKEQGTDKKMKEEEPDHIFNNTLMEDLLNHEPLIPAFNQPDFSGFPNSNPLPTGNIASNPNGAVFEVINVPSCSIPGTCCCTVNCGCPNCVVHNNVAKPQNLEFLNNDAQFGSNLILTLDNKPPYVKEIDTYTNFLNQLIGPDSIQDPTETLTEETTETPPTEEPNSCTCADDSCFCTNCETHGIIEGYKLDDIFGSKLLFDYQFKQEKLKSPSETVEEPRKSCCSKQ